MLAALIALTATQAGVGSTPAPSVAVEGTAFRITLADGRVVPQAELPGTILVIGEGGGERRIRIDAVEPDGADPDREIMLYSLSERDATGQWRNVCAPDADGRRFGFPLAGAFTAAMRHVAAPGRLTIVCTAGAEGKCVRFGYKPWRRAPDGSLLAQFYQACLRLVRADYCGDGAAHTRVGMPIDIFDRIGIRRVATASAMSLEAAFGPDGAVCVRRTRVPALLTLNALAASCPRLAGHLGEDCGDSTLALLYVRSLAR